MQRMWIRARAWWYLHFVKAEAWPPDVREYILRSSLRAMGDGTGLKPEQQVEVATHEIAALSREDLTPEFKLEMLRDGFQRLARVPSETCSACGLPVYTHSARKADGKSYHEHCARSAESDNK